MLPLVSFRSLVIPLLLAITASSASAPAHTPARKPAPTPAPTPAPAPASELCKVGEACLKGEEVYYPGSTFFIDPDGMTSLQLLFVFLVYGYVLFVSADMIGDGAELLLLVPGYADMVGSIVLPILGAIPDGMMVLFSGIGPLAVAQENVAVGVGALAGSTIMLLTLPWILSVYAAQVDMDASGKCVGYDKKPGNRNTGTMATGCQFQEGVSKNAWLMFLTSLSYFVIQIPAFMVDDQKTKAQYPDEKAYLEAVTLESKSENFWALIGCVATLFFFVFYLYLQYLAALKKAPPISCLACLLPPPPAAVDINLVKQNGVLPLICHYRENFRKNGKMRVGDGEVTVAYGAKLGDKLMENEKVKGIPADLCEILKTLFAEYSKMTPKGGINNEHMRDLCKVIGLNYTPEVFNEKFKTYDKDDSKYLDKTEFFTMFYDMITGPDFENDTCKPQAAADAEEGGGDDDEDEEDEMPEEFKDLSPEEQQKQIMITSCKQMFIGTFLVLIFSDPMVDVLAQIGKITGVPAFYVSFILAPLASNASELVSSYKLAARKTSTAITQSLQTLEGAACMNNTFCLGIFFVLIFYQGLAWKFTAETLSIFFVQLLVFLIVISKNTQDMKAGVIIFMCYPVSLVFVAVLEAMGLD